MNRWVISYTDRTGALRTLRPMKQHEVSRKVIELMRKSPNFTPKAQGIHINPEPKP